MIYDFDEPTCRKNTNCYKWDLNSQHDLIPMWVADMDFRTAPPIIEALHRRVEHGIFGYTKVPAEYFEAVCQWFGRKHQWHIEPKEIIYTSGVIPALSAIIKAMTEPGDKVLVQTPVYNHFFSSIRNNGCEVLPSGLKADSNGRYTVDWEDFESKCQLPDTKLFVLCNPHNPTSRVWSREELERMAKICKQNNVFLISDEIHCEIMMPGFEYTPFGTLNEDILPNYAVCCSVTKAFNIAGLQISNIICKDLKTRRKIDRAININEVCDVNPFGVLALIEAYTNPECGEWLSQLNKYIHQNYLTARELLLSRIPEATVTPLEGTYLMWVNLSNLCPSAATMETELIEKAGVWLNAGTHYGLGGEHHMRINLATQRANIQEGIDRICKYLGR